MDGLRNCPNQIAIFAHGGLEVNDFDRGRFMTKKLGVRLGGVKPSQRVLKMKIDGAPRKRELTPESAVRQATLRPSLRAGSFSKGARSGAPPIISVNVKRQTRVILPHLSGPPAWN